VLGEMTLQIASKLALFGYKKNMDICNIPNFWKVLGPFTVADLLNSMSRSAQ